MMLQRRILDDHRFELSDMDLQQLKFLSLCLERWLPKDEYCFNRDLPGIVSIFQSLVERN
jgi:hypothetical protein